MIKAVFVDTSAFMALVDPKDSFHDAAVKILAKLHEEATAITTSNFILDETYTVIRIKRGLEIALKFNILLTDRLPHIRIYRVTLKDELAAWPWFIKEWKDLSYTDCVSFAQMKRLDLNHVFAFDKHYQRAGFSLLR